MKCIKEDIANIERAIENDKLNTVGAMPIVMADAVYQSEKVQEEIDKEMEKHNKEVKLNKVIGAENQPVPDLPEKPKVALDESLFEDYEELLNTSILKEDLQDERIKTAKKHLESALKALNSYLDRTTNESLEDDCDFDFFIKKHKGLNKNFDRNKYGKYFDKDGKLIPEFQKEYFSLKKTEALEDDDDFETDLPIDFEPADFDDYVIEDIISVGQSLKDVVRYQATIDSDYFVLTFKDGTKKAWFIHNSIYIPDNDFKECLSEGRKKAERDLFTQIMDDLSATNYNMKDKTKFPDMKLKDKYDDKSLGVEYRKDGFVDIDVREDSKEKLDFAKQVADAYGVESLDIVKEGDQYRLSIRIPED